MLFGRKWQASEEERGPSFVSGIKNLCLYVLLTMNSTMLSAKRERLVGVLRLSCTLKSFPTFFSSPKHESPKRHRQVKIKS